MICRGQRYTPEFVKRWKWYSRPVGGSWLRCSANAGHAFATPTIVHFGAVLGLSGILSAPWDWIGTVAILWGLGGLSGVVYAVIVTRRMRVQAAYRPEFEDWLFHVLLPIAAYVTMVVAAFAARSHLRETLFCVGAAALLLLFIGIHNAWDAVTYHVFVRKQGQREDGRQP